LRQDTKKGYQLRGNGVEARLKEMQSEVGMRKMEALGLTGVPIWVVVG
jgi:hypothetical protein